MCGKFIAIGEKLGPECVCPISIAEVRGIDNGLIHKWELCATASVCVLFMYSPYVPSRIIAFASAIIGVSASALSTRNAT